MATASIYRLSLILCLSSVLLGCGGKSLPGVSGTITMDGKPVDKATVMYVPLGGNTGRPAVGVTNSSGHYSLQFSTAKSGILPGKYRVTITTFSSPVNDGDGNMVGEKAPETIPDAFNSKSTLEADVSTEGGTFDFELKSAEGKVMQPKPPVNS